MDLDIEIRKVKCGQVVLEYLLTRKLVKNINLRVKPDGGIIVSANETVPAEYIDDFVRRKQDYIMKALRQYAENQYYSYDIPKKYVGGESFIILGKSLRLKLIQSDEEQVTADGVYVYLAVKDKTDYNRKKSLMSEWMKVQQVQVFQEICNEIYPVFRKYGVEYPTLKLRYMATQWGSCQPKKGIITLNTKLFEAPRNCIEYVVLHEFVHFIHSNHSKEFYEMVEMLMPDWKERKNVLEKQQ